MYSYRKKPTKDGGFAYTFRARMPERQKDGTIVYRQVERGTRARSLAEFHIRAKQLEREYHELANLQFQEDGEPAPEAVTFAEAATYYMNSGGESTYLVPILERIGLLPLSGVNQSVVQGVAAEIAGHCKASYQNRIIFTPILAVLNYAAKLSLCPRPVLIRPKGHDTSPPLAIPDEAWFDAVLPHLSIKFRAAALLITSHGMRISEALRRVPSDLDLKRGLLSIPTSKTGEAFLLPLADNVLDACNAIFREIDERNRARILRGAKPLKPPRWLFGTNKNSNFYKAVRKACEAADQPVYGSHAIGRHSFATRILRDEGKSLAFLKAAGRWKKIAMPADRYGHLERSEVDSEVREIASKWRVGKGESGVVKLADKRVKR